MRKYQFISEEKLNKAIHRDSIKTDFIFIEFRCNKNWLF